MSFIRALRTIIIQTRWIKRQVHPWSKGISNLDRAFITQPRVELLGYDRGVEEQLDAATGVNLFGGIDGYTRDKDAEALGNIGAAAGRLVRSSGWASAG
jgi:hypothetical protein